MVEISLSGSGEGPGWVTAPGYSTAGFRHVRDGIASSSGLHHPSGGNYRPRWLATLGLSTPAAPSGRVIGHNKIGSCFYTE